MPGKRRSHQEILAVLQRIGSGENVEKVCRELGVSTGTYFRWKSKYDGMDKSELARARQLEQENARLKRILAERDLEIDAMKEVLQKKW
jgi:putative transposase